MRMHRRDGPRRGHHAFGDTVTSSPPVFPRGYVFLRTWRRVTSPRTVRHSLCLLGVLMAGLGPPKFATLRSVATLPSDWQCQDPTKVRGRRREASDLRLRSKEDGRPTSTQSADDADDAV